MKARVLLPLLVIALVVLLVIVEGRRRSAEEQLKQLSVRLEQLQGNTQENQQKAQEIVQRVRRLMDIPADVEPTVAAIVDVTQLRARNPFYNKAENGDYLLVTPTRAILFDPDRDVILDVVPVQIEPQEGAASSDGQ